VKEDKKKERGEVSRRDFLVGAGAVVVGGAIGAGITYPLVAGNGDGEVVTTTKTVSVPTTVTTTVGDGATATVTDTVTTTVGGDGATVTKTVTTTAPGDGVAWPYLEPEETIVSAQASSAFADVKNGRIVRMRPLRVHEKYPDLPKTPWTITARGKTFTAPLKSPLCAYSLAYRKRTDSPNRILYPLKRVDWEPGGDPAKINAQNRGISKFKRISWDEATDIIASELTRVVETYGTSAVLSGSKSWGGWNQKNVSRGLESIRSFLNYYLLSKYGSAPTTFTWHNDPTTSTGGMIGGQFVIGTTYESTSGQLQDIADNTELLLMWANDSLTKTWGFGDGAFPGMINKWFGDELGIKRVAITPYLNRGNGIHNDKWIPIMTAKDPAMMLAIAYTWITENSYDQDYLDTHTVGFDKWKAYVMGDEDGVPKTPEWASPLCGVPEWTIKAVARQWATKVTTWQWGRRGGHQSRGTYGYITTMMQLYLLAMQGWGGPGKHQAGNCGISMPSSSPSPQTGGISDDAIVNAAMVEDLGIRLSGQDKDRGMLPSGYLEQCINDPPVTWYMWNDPFYQRVYPHEGDSEVRMWWGGAMAFTGGETHGFRKQDACRSPKLECIISANMYFEDSQQFCDIVLPIANEQEVDDIDSGSQGSFSVLRLKKKCVEPIGEAKSDPEAIAEVAKKLDFYDEYTAGLTVWDRIRRGYDNSGWADLVSWEEFNEKGYIAQPIDPEWYQTKPRMLAFYEDPEANPLPTPTGKLEIESQSLLENFPDDKERLPVAHWVRGGPAADGWCFDEDPLLSERVTDYPLTMCSPTRDWGLHSHHTDIPWSREIRYMEGWDGYWYSPLKMSPVDAAARGIKYGDIVRFYNERGGVLACARVTEQMMPGNVQIDEAGGGDIIIPGKLCRGGNPNAINPSPAYTGKSMESAYGWLLEVEKVTGAQMQEWRENYPEAFARDYDPGCGPIFTGWVEGGM
jgi:trimethylamine-N-oxide reductase (cytochrome c)